MNAIRNFRQIVPRHLCSKIVIGDRLVDWSKANFRILKEFPRITIKETAKKHWIILKYGQDIFSLDVLLKKNSLILLAKSEAETCVLKKTYAEVNITQAFLNLPGRLDLHTGKICYGDDSVEISFDKRLNAFQRFVAWWKDKMEATL